ncbi:MAG: hypothetical protein IKO31_08080 [Bacteroidales bacterium]|nr:hypothetical protein [Bacteroidales bacterium]
MSERHGADERCRINQGGSYGPSIQEVQEECDAVYNLLEDIRDLRKQMTKFIRNVNPKRS